MGKHSFMISCNGIVNPKGTHMVDRCSGGVLIHETQEKRKSVCQMQNTKSHWPREPGDKVR